MRTSASFLFAFGTLITASLDLGVADDFTLKDGRKLTGNVVHKNGDLLVVELSPGNMLLLNPQEVKLHQQNPKGESAYAEALKTATDTVDSHMQMAGIARRNQMLDQERAHYERVIELEPDNALARGGLGYTRNKSDGRWMLREEEMRDRRGKKSVGGTRYRFPEVLAMEEARKDFETKRAALVTEIKRALTNLNNPQKSAKAQATLDGLQGPLASAAIAFILFPKPNAISRASATPATKALFIPILQRLGDGEAISTLIKICRESDPSPEHVRVRSMALEVLKQLAPERAFFAFLEDLGAGKGPKTNLAADLLKEIGDERAVLPLIQNLFRTERVETGGSNATNAGMSSDGGVGFSRGDPKIVRNVSVENPSVLAALIALTNQNFNYDQKRWLEWYEQEYAAFSGDLRRDR